MKSNQNVDDIKKLFNSQLKNKDQYHALILFQVNPSGFTCKSNIFVLNSNVLICKIMNVKNKVLKLQSNHQYLKCLILKKLKNNFSKAE